MIRDTKRNTASENYLNIIKNIPEIKDRENALFKKGDFWSNGISSVVIKKITKFDVAVLKDGIEFVYTKNALTNWISRGAKKISP